jgi:drug/metabolite transporter (DMT)-like permease
VTHPRARPWEIHLALAAAQTGFALFPIFGKLALGSIPPLVFATFRAVCAALLLELMHSVNGRERIRKGDRRKLLLYALLGVSINQILFILGLSLTTAINTSILTTTIPVFTIAAAAVLGRERLTFRSAAGIVLAGAGALTLLDAQRFDWSSATFRGDVLLLSNCLSYSLYLVLSRPILAHYRPATFTATVFRYGALPILLVATPELRRFEPARVPPLAWASMAAVILLCTVIPYFLNSWALARTHASHVAFYVFIQPLIASALAMAVLGETLTWKTVLAGTLIFAGLAVGLFRERLPARAIP